MRQMRDVEATHIAELDPLQLLPEPFAGVQLRGIGWQALQMQALRRTPRQELLDGLAAMDRRTIPDEHHPAWDLAQQVLEKPDDVVRVEGVALAAEVELAPGRDGTDRRQMVTGTPFPQNRGLAYGGIGAHDTGQRIKPRLVYEENCLLLDLRPLLMAGQVSSRHCAMAASLRCRARLAGFCGLQRSASSKRPT
jgi:hypothetical protein